MVESQKVSCFPIVACCVRVCLLGLLPAPVCYVCEWVVSCVQCTYSSVCLCPSACVGVGGCVDGCVSPGKFCVVEKLKFV